VNNLRTSQIGQYQQPVPEVRAGNYSPHFHRKFRTVKKFMFSEIKKNRPPKQNRPPGQAAFAIKQK
jgi:hypothetical protein